MADSPGFGTSEGLCDPETNTPGNTETMERMEEKMERMGEKEKKFEEEQRPGIQLLRSWINKNIKVPKHCKFRQYTIIFLK